MIRSGSGAGGVHVEALVDEHSLGRSDQHVGRVGQLETDLACRMIGGELLGHVVLDRIAPALHGHERDEPVAAIDTDALGDGAEVVGGIQVAGIVAGHLATPSELPFAIEGQCTAIVDVTAFGVGDVPEEAHFHHLADHEHVGPVAAVLGHHVDAAGLFLGADEPPAFVERHGGGHLAEHVFASPHGGDADLGMDLHARAANDGVQVVAFQHSQVVFRAFRVPFRFASACLLHDTDGSNQVGLLYVAQRGNFYSGIQCEP